MPLTALHPLTAALSPGLSCILRAASVNQKRVTCSKFPFSPKSDRSSSGVDAGSGVELDPFELLCPADASDLLSFSSVIVSEEIFDFFLGSSSDFGSMDLFLGSSFGSVSVCKLFSAESLILSKSLSFFFRSVVLRKNL